jgi:CRP/FNR family transcriptional regulator, cyclic AMP receptor protein
MPADRELLARVPLFAQLPAGELDRLAGAMREIEADAGTRLIAEHQGGVTFFVLVRGQASVRLGDESVRVLRPGDWFGEMALIDGDARAADVVADTSVRCFGMESRDFRPFVEAHPGVAWALLEELVRRLRSMDARAVALTG